MHELQGDPKRSEFIARTLLVGGAALAGGVLSGPLQSSSAATKEDVRALQLVLAVEYTEDAFYREALERAGLRGEVRRYASTVAEQERDHLAFIKGALGKAADPPPKFDFGSATRSQDAFAIAAAKLEDLAVAAYNGQATNVSRATLEAAATVVSVEARHAAWIRSIVGEPPAPDATDKPMAADDVYKGLRELGLQS